MYTGQVLGKKRISHFYENQDFLYFPNQACLEGFLLVFLKKRQTAAAPRVPPAPGRGFPQSLDPGISKKVFFFEVCEAPQACCNLTKSLYYHFTYFCMVLHIFARFCIYLQGFTHILQGLLIVYMVLHILYIFLHGFIWFLKSSTYFHIFLHGFTHIPHISA